MDKFNSQIKKAFSNINKSEEELEKNNERSALSIINGDRLLQQSKLF